MRPALAIFTKTPGLSPVKTRLAEAIGRDAAEQFHRLAAAATAEVAAACADAVEPCWAVAEDDPRAGAAWPDFPVILQGLGGLGKRLHRVYAELQTRHGAALMIGTDIPQVHPTLIRRAVAALDDPRADYVLGPARDGGFWLFGGKRPIAETAWVAVPYSGPDTADALCRNLAGSGKLRRLPALTDVDAAADLAALGSALARLDSPTPAQRRLKEWLLADRPPVGAE